jgi:hypothetical protein
MSDPLAKSLTVCETEAIRKELNSRTTGRYGLGFAWTTIEALLDTIDELRADLASRDNE